MGKGASSGRLLRFVFRLLGPSWGRKILARRVRTRSAHLPPFSFPLDPALYTRVLIILPSKRLQVLHQLKNLAELTAFFKNASITILAEETSAPLVRLIERTNVIEYEYDQKKLFSSAFNQFIREFHGIIDLCCLLTRDEDLPLLYLAGMTAAPVRIGYVGSGGSPFLNLQVEPLPSRTYFPEWNSALAQMLGAKRAKQARWGASKETMAEIDHLLKEMHIDPRARLVGVDADFARRRFGASWAERFIKALIPATQGSIYLYAKDDNDPGIMEWLSQFNLPLMHSLSVSQMAALISRSALIVTGNTLLFGLATLMETRVVGLFDIKHLAAYCPVTPMIKGIPFERTPDEKTIDNAAIAVAELLLVNE
jgi:ADP-heptose:LPS heptosyltransferase